MKEEIKKILAELLLKRKQLNEEATLGDVADLIEDSTEKIVSLISSSYFSKEKVMEIILKTYILGGKHTISEIEAIIKKEYGL